MIEINPTHDMIGEADREDTTKLHPKPPTHWNFLNFDAVFPGIDNGARQSRATFITPLAPIMLQASTLFQNLASISFCLASGPGFQVQAIQGAIMASIMRQAM